MGRFAFLCAAAALLLIALGTCTGAKQQGSANPSATGVSSPGNSYTEIKESCELTDGTKNIIQNAIENGTFRLVRLYYNRLLICHVDKVLEVTQKAAKAAVNAAMVAATADTLEGDKEALRYFELAHRLDPNPETELLLQNARKKVENRRDATY